MKGCQFCMPFEEWPQELIVGNLPASIVLLSQDQFFRGWCLVVAKVHVVDLFELSDADRRALEADVASVSQAIKALLKPDLMNYASFGNVIPHLHWNVIPRYIDDGLWGLPPWPHPSRSLSRPEAIALSTEVRQMIGATVS